MNNYILTSFLVLLVASSAVHAVLPEKAEIVVYRIEGVLERKRDDQPYVQILNTLNQHMSTQLDFQFFHALRAAEIFNNNGSDCLFPGSVLAYDFGKTLIESEPIQVAKAYFIAATPISAQRVIDLQQPALRIGYRRGNTYGGNINTLKHHNLIPLNSGADIRNLLERNRIDVFLGYLPDSLSIINAIPDKPLTYSEDSLFYSQNDSFLCQDTPQSQSLVRAMNDEIIKMKNSGQLAQILKPLN